MPTPVQPFYADEYPEFSDDAVNSLDFFIDSDFYLDGYTNLSGAIIKEIKIPCDCYVIKIGFKIGTERTEGTAFFQVSRNGIATPVDITCNASYPLDRKIDYSFGNPDCEFSEGDILRIHLTTTLFEPLSNQGNVYLVIREKVI